MRGVSLSKVMPERSIYLDLLQQGLQRHGVELIGYCLMSNHIHLIALPDKQDALARSLKDTHMPVVAVRASKLDLQEPSRSV